MKTNLPESRNRNLPPPPATGVSLRQRPLVPPGEPREGPSALRSFVVMLVIGGLLAAGIWYYIRGAEDDVRVRNQVEAALISIGAELWRTSMTTGLSAETEETSADLADLPRVITAVREAARGLAPEIRIVEQDSPGGMGTASHQILFLINQRAVLIIRVWYERSTGRFTFIGEANVIVPSRRDMEKKAAASPSPPAVPPTSPGTVPPPGATSAPPTVPGPNLPTPAPSAPPPAPPAEKVSEPR